MFIYFKLFFIYLFEYSLHIGVGRGVFAGVTYKAKDVIDVSPTVSFPIDETYDIQLMNYIFGSDHEDYILALIGADMLVNHHDQNVNSEYFWWKKPSVAITDASVRSYSPYTEYTQIAFKAKKTIFAGDEIFTSYGDSDWFETRNIPYKKTTIDGSMELSRPLDELKRSGHCLSDVSVRNSTIIGAGQGLFAERAFKKGEVVSISPVLIMPKHVLNDINSNSVLINYVLSLVNSDVALFPLGRAGMVNNGGEEASLTVHWYDWESRRVLPMGQMPEAVRYKHIDELEAHPFASLDICYVATRDITKGEELTLPYGEQWESTWQIYQMELMKYKTGTSEGRPLFMEPIGLNADMFPPSWKVSCIGHTCEDYASEEEIVVDAKAVAVEKGFGSFSSLMSGKLTKLNWLLSEKKKDVGKEEL